MSWGSCHDSLAEEFVSLLRLSWFGEHDEYEFIQLFPN